MKLKFNLKLVLFAFFALPHCFASASSAVALAAARSSFSADVLEDTRVQVGVRYISDQHEIRHDAFNSDPVKTSQESKQTSNIIQLLSNKNKVSAKGATIDQKRIIATSVMGTILVHNGAKKLTPHDLKEGDVNFRHFRALELIEGLSVALNEGLIGREGEQTVDAYLSVHWARYSDLETYSQINADMFAMWFNAALKEHNPGFVRLVEIAEEKRRVEVEELAKIEIEKAAAERKRQRELEEEAAKRQRELEEENARKEVAQKLANEAKAAAKRVRAEKHEEPVAFGGSDAFSTPKKSVGSEAVNEDDEKHAAILSPSKRNKMIVAREDAPYTNGHVLEVAVDGENLKFQYFRISDDLDNKNYLGLGMSRSDFETRIKSAAIEDLAQFYQEMIAETTEDAEEGSEVDAGGVSVTIEQLTEAFTNYYLGSGQLALASVLLSETSICIWAEKNGFCTLESVYSKGGVLSDAAQINAIQAKIKSLDESLVHLYRTKDDHYDSLQLVAKKKSMMTRQTTAFTSYFSNSAQLRLISAVSFATFSAFAFAKITSGVPTNVLGGLFNFGSKQFASAFSGLLRGFRK